MSFKAIFKLQNKEYNVLSCSFGFNQEHSNTDSRPTSVKKSHLINLVIESDVSDTIREWAFDAFMTYDGTISFLKRDSNATLKELNFKDAHLSIFSEFFDSENNEPFKFELHITAHKLEMFGIDFNNDWVL